MAVLIGSARIDERGKISGGKAGDQTGKEVSTQAWYKHSKGWVVIRAKKPEVREKIAKNMEYICANNKIGYDQSNRYGLFNAVKDKGFDASKCTVLTETDCSASVRVCARYAGITVGDFNTSNEKSVLQATGAFDVLTDSKYTNSSDYLLRGDILVTKTKGHTVVVLSNGAKAVASATPTPAPTPAPSTSRYKAGVPNPTLKSGSKGSAVRELQTLLNRLVKTDVNGKKMKDLVVDGDFGSATKAKLIVIQTRLLGKKEADGVYGPKTATAINSIA